MKQLIILTMLVSPISVSASDKQAAFVPASAQKIIVPTQKVTPVQKAVIVQKTAPIQKAVIVQKTPVQKAAPADDLDRKVDEKANKVRRRFCVLALLELRAERLAGFYERQAVRMTKQAERLAKRRDARRSNDQE